MLCFQYSQSSWAISDVTSSVKLVPLVTRIARTGLGGRLGTRVNPRIHVGYVWFGKFDLNTDIRIVDVEIF